MDDPHAELKEAVEQARFFTTSMPMDDGGHRIVCASKRREDGRGLTGNSFWVARRGSQWFAGAWGGSLYRLPDARRVAEFCITWLSRAPDDTRADFDDSIKQEFGLVSITDEDFESLTD